MYVLHEYVVVNISVEDKHICDAFAKLKTKNLKGTSG